MKAETLSFPGCNEDTKRPLWPFVQPLVRHAPYKAGEPTDSEVGRTGHWYLVEDYVLCHRARQCDFPIIADTTIRLWHIGDYGYNGEDAGIDRQRFSDCDDPFEG